MPPPQAATHASCPRGLQGIAAASVCRTDGLPARASAAAAARLDVNGVIETIGLTEQMFGAKQQVLHGGWSDKEAAGA
jgi:hypothetical protein